MLDHIDETSLQRTGRVQWQGKGGQSIIAIPGGHAVADAFGGLVVLCRAGACSTIDVGANVRELTMVRGKFVAVRTPFEPKMIVIDGARRTVFMLPEFGRAFYAYHD